MPKFRPELLPEASDYYENELTGIKWKEGKAFALCPFHRERSASFLFDYDTGRFKCFGCSQGGSSIVYFHMVRYGMDWIDAVKDLGAWK